MGIDKVLGGDGITPIQPSGQSRKKKSHDDFDEDLRRAAEKLPQLKPAEERRKAGGEAEEKKDKGKEKKKKGGKEEGGGTLDELA
jgi:hypothetical protein